MGIEDNDGSDSPTVPPSTIGKRKMRSRSNGPDQSVTATTAHEGSVATTVRHTDKKQKPIEIRDSGTPSLSRSEVNVTNSWPEQKNEGNVEGDEECESQLSLQPSRVNPFATKQDNPNERTPKSRKPPLPANRFSNSKYIIGRDKKPKKQPKERGIYPAIEFANHARLYSHLKIADLQSLVLYLLADGLGPQWVAVTNRRGIRRVVVVMVPGLELDMFTGGTQIKMLQNNTKRLRITPDNYYPIKLKSDQIPDALRPLSDIFSHVWPIMGSCDHNGGQYSRVYSPISAMLTSPIPRNHQGKEMKKDTNHKGPIPVNSRRFQSKPTAITKYLASQVEQQEYDFVVHPVWFSTPEAKQVASERRKGAGQAVEDGWVDSSVESLEEGNVPEEEIEQGSVTVGRTVLVVDCEMCKAEDGTLVLSRVSVVDWDGKVVMDELVKPDAPIKDYLTQYSGITAAMLRDVTTTLSEVQKKLMAHLTPQTILVGHSLSSDLNALKITHPFLADTSILYPHPRGSPYKQSLKFLAQKYLSKEIQKGVGGHDSVEDARACLDLIKQKCERGPQWGSGDMNMEPIFKRLARVEAPKRWFDYSSKHKTGAVIDWKESTHGYGNQASLAMHCKSDQEVVEGIESAAKGLVTEQDHKYGEIDFIWGRLRELELARGWWQTAKAADEEAVRQSALTRLGVSSVEDVDLSASDLGDAVARTVKDIAKIHESLPRGTAFIVYSGTGDPREMHRLQAMRQQYQREYQTKNWDNLSVKWTDTEMQALSQACKTAREGIGFVVVK